MNKKNDKKLNSNKNNINTFDSLPFEQKIKYFEANFNQIKRVNNIKNFQNISKSQIVNNKINNNSINANINNKKNNVTKEKNVIDDFEISNLEEDFDDFNDDQISKSDIGFNQVNVDLWEIIPISTPSKKAKKEYMKSFMSTIVYNGDMFKDKLSESTNKSIIIYDSFMQNFNINQIKDYFVYMSYRNGLFNTKFLPGGKNNYTSDCGWGCMLRCCQMMLSRAFIKLRFDEINKEINKEINTKLIKQEILYLFYDKFITIENIHVNKKLFEIYKNILRKKVNVLEIIPPYSIYVLTLLGNCPKIFTSDHNMIKTMIKINKILFNESIAMIHFNGSVDKKKVLQDFCEKIESNDISSTDDYILYNNEKYKFKKTGIIFISLRLGLQKIEASFIEMIPKLFYNLHNNIGFVSGKKKRAYYFIGLEDKKLIFADPHFNQNSETDEKNFPSYSINDLFLISVKEMSSELTVGAAISSQKDLEQFFNDLIQLKNINPDFIGFKEK